MAGEGYPRLWSSNSSCGSYRGEISDTVREAVKKDFDPKILRPCPLLNYIYRVKHICNILVFIYWKKITNLSLDIHKNRSCNAYYSNCYKTANNKELSFFTHHVLPQPWRNVLVDICINRFLLIPFRFEQKSFDPNQLHMLHFSTPALNILIPYFRYKKDWYYFKYLFCIHFLRLIITFIHD